MALGVIVTILVIGLLLILMEIFFIPGTTVFGFAGGVAVIAGIALMYTYQGQSYGNITLVVSAVLVTAAFIVGLKIVESNKLAVKGEITSRVNILESKGTEVGDRGETVTDLRPNGKAVIKGHKLEVYSGGDFISRGTTVMIIEITKDKIFVAPLNA